VKGKLNKRLIMVKQIPVNKITGIASFRNELSITWDGTTDMFFMKYDESTVTELCEKIRRMI
jgi:hypothetical protein